MNDLTARELIEAMQAEGSVPSHIDPDNLIKFYELERTEQKVLFIPESELKLDEGWHVVSAKHDYTVPANPAGLGSDWEAIGPRTDGVKVTVRKTFEEKIKRTGPPHPVLARTHYRLKLDYGSALSNTNYITCSVVCQAGKKNTMARTPEELDAIISTLPKPEKIKWGRKDVWIVGGITDIEDAMDIAGDYSNKYAILIRGYGTFRNPEDYDEEQDGYASLTGFQLPDRYLYVAARNEITAEDESIFDPHATEYALVLKDWRKYETY